MKKRCDRNRNRSKRRAIYCPVHGCYLHSVSQKFSLYADRAEHLHERGMGNRYALLTVANQKTIALDGEWLEAFWCDHCQTTQWYHVHKHDHGYDVAIAPPELWQQAVGVIQPNGNPSVGEFTRTQARMVRFEGVKGFKFII